MTLRAEARPEEGPAEAEMAPLLSVRELSVRFPQADLEVRAVNGISYDVFSGRTLAIIGESGSGKTVSSRALMGLLPDNAIVSGSIRYLGRELLGLSEREMRAYRGPHLAMIFQDPARSLDPTMRVGRQICEAITAHDGDGRESARARALELLERVRIPAAAQRYDEYPHQLSGGMQQRVMIAVALACHPKLLIADEATTALDVTTQARIMGLLLELQRELGMAIVMISHNMGLAASYSDEVLVMYAGSIVERAPTKELFANIRMPYTEALLAAIPRLSNPLHQRLPVVGGRPPDLTSLPPGCPFEPRCPYAKPRCALEPPVLRGSGGHEFACHFPLGHGAEQ